jgi:hypothetical protein
MFAAKIDDLCGRRGNKVQALALWRHPVASSKTRDVLHWAMCLASYRRICMVIKIDSNFTALFVVIDFLFAHNRG